MNQSKKWLWVVVSIIVLALVGYFGWRIFKNPSAKTASSNTPEDLTQSASDDLDNLEGDLSGLDDNFNQLDKIDASEDQTPSL